MLIKQKQYMKQKQKILTKYTLTAEGLAELEKEDGASEKDA